MGKVINCIDNSGSFRVYIGLSTDLTEEARKIHNTTPVATAALGRVITGAALMGLMLKGPENKLTVQFKGDGPARQILATANGAGNVKGYISNGNIELPHRSDGHLNVGGAIGHGELTVIKDLGLKEPYIGKIELVSGEIAEDLTTYYYMSEQQKTSIALGVKIKTDYSVLCSGGMFIQMLPNPDERAVEELENLIREMKPLTTYIEEALLRSAGKTEEALLEDIANSIFGSLPDEFSLQTLNFSHIGWECDCSKERMAKALSTIGEKDLREILEEDKGAELQCQFCRSKYNFTEAELEEIINSL